MKNVINFIISGLLTFANYFLGGIDIALKSLIIVIILDYISGILSAFYNKKINSKIGLKGIIKKLCYLLVVMLAVVIDNLTLQDGLIRNLVIYFLVSNDGISIIENLGKMNVKLPKKLIDSLEQLKKEE